MTNSEKLFERGCRVLPGGVNSPVRAFRAVGGTPRFIVKGLGSHILDADGLEYIDYVGSWGPMILGHSHPDILKAVYDRMVCGLSFGAPTGLEVEMAEKMVSMLPGVEMVRMVNSGTEAVMSAVRLARGATGRDKIIKFEGNYHGHSDSLLVSAGSGIATFSIPGTPGVTAGTAADTLVCAYNNLDSVRATLEANKGQVACIIVEPVAGNMGAVAPAEGFLQGLRELCDEFGALLIFDEVISGFRVALGGVQERYSVMPDLCTFGKIIGGGFPVGCFAGRAEIMDQLAPNGPVYQAGTLSGNPVAMEAGLAQLGALEAGVVPASVNPEAAGQGIYDYLEFLGARLEAGLKAAIVDTGVSAQVNRVGALATIFFTDQPVRDWDGAATCDTDKFARYFSGMLERGYLIAPSQFEALFLSCAHTPAEVDAFVEAAREVLASL